MRITICLFIITFFSFSNYCHSVQTIIQTQEPMVIDGLANETIWQQVSWHLIDQPIIGKLPDIDDFGARYKLTWSSEAIYLLVEITDDKLFDGHPIPTERYWDDDCLEIFIDEDASGGNHQFNYNAFAYHIALDNQVVDIGEKNAHGDVQVLLFNEHAINRWRRSRTDPKKIIWEVAVKIFDDKFEYQNPDSENNLTNKPAHLHKNKEIGFMLAYCDNDGSEHRESFIGSVAIKPINGDKNLGYIDASVFGRIRLIEQKGGQKAE